jgi:hypothetical protein
MHSWKFLKRAVRRAPPSLSRKALIDAFVDKRLLVAEDESVRPTHDAVLRIWPQAREIIQQAADLIQARHTLEPIVQAW